MLSNEDFQECREKLAARLRVESIPDEVWDVLAEGDAVYDAITHGDKQSRQALDNEARKLFKVYRAGSAASVAPGRGEEGGAPPEIAVEPSEYSRKRAQAFSEVAAALAGKHPRVKQFRRRHLGGRLLGDDEADAFLEDLLEDQGKPYGRGRGILKKLFRLADKLAKTYRWREGEAVWFVLTGSAPQVRPLQVTTSVSESTLDYHPDTARITLTADAWVNAEEVEQVFREVQRQILGGDARPLSERTLVAVTFVARRMREYPKEPWSKRWEAWNKTCPKEWRYSNYRGFRQVFERFIHRRYEWPRYKPHESTS
jgi:hypothetical protein